MRPDPVDVLVVAHNSGPLLTEAVESALAELSPGQVMVLDAQSVDGAVRALRDRHPGVRIVEVENRGFAAGNNEGLRRTNREFALLLNPDAILAPGAVRKLLARARQEPRAAVVGAKIRDPGGSLQRDSFGRFPTVLGLVALHLGRLSKRLAGRSLSPADFSSPLAVDWVTGACMLLRRRAWAEVGGLDEGFFLYLEDVDFCRRLRRAGWQVLVEPAAECIHHLGQSGSQPATGRRAYRNSLLRYARVHRKPGLWVLAQLQLLRERARASASR